MNKERPANLNPTEQLRVAVCVHRLYEAGSSHKFDPSLHLEDARRVVKALAPRTLSERFKFSYASFSESSQSIVSGATEEKKKKIVVGAQGYRIGWYVVVKPASGRSLVIEPFWDQGADDMVSGTDPEKVQIFYDPKNSEPTKIRILHPKVKHFLGHFSITTYPGINIWKAERPKSSKIH